jgi:hypothetical protein
VNLFDDAISASLGHLLTRPLFLKAWCDYVHDDLDHRAPESLSDLARQLLFALARRRRLFNYPSGRDPVAIGEYADAVAALSSWLGRLGHYFAERGFGPQKLDDPAGIELYKEAIVGRLMDAAISSGLLIRILNKYYMPKVPLVEYCIGKYLADDVSLNPDGPKQLINTFRRWIWRPNLHDILDFTFDSLWSFAGDNDRSRQWARDLLRWIVETGRHDCIRRTCPPYSQDDLVRPFAFAALRWHALNASGNALDLALAKEAAQAVGPSLLEGTCLSKSVAHFLGDSVLPTALWWSAMLGLFAQYSKRHTTRDERQSLESAIETFASCLRRSAAPDILNRILALSRDDSVFPFDRFTLVYASSGVATRVHSDDAVQVLQHWISVYPDANHGFFNWIIEGRSRTIAMHISEDMVDDIIEKWLESVDDHATSSQTRTLLTELIEPTASHMSRVRARKKVNRWISQYNNTENSSSRIALQTAICSASSQIRDIEALGMIRVLMRQLKCADSDDARRPWQQAIANAAEKLGKRNPVGRIKKWLREYRDSRTGDAVKVALRFAVSTLIGVLDSKDALAVIEPLTILHNSLNCDNEQVAWSQMIVDAAIRLSEDTAAIQIRKWIRKYNNVTNSRVANNAFQSAIWGAVRRIRPDECAGVVKQLIDQLANSIKADALAKYESSRIEPFDNPKSDEYEKISSWESAISIAAWNADEKNAEEIVENLQKQIKYAASKDAKEFWTRTLLNAAERMPFTISAGMVPQFIRHYKNVRDPGEDQCQSRYRQNSIEEIATRARGRQAELVCAVLIKEGMLDVALRVAGAGSEVAILSRMERNERSKPGIAYRAILREKRGSINEELMLDINSPFVPDGIREGLQPFPKSEGLSPRAQFDLLCDERKISLEERYNEIDKKGSHRRDNFRNRWCENAREIGFRLGLLDRAVDVRTINGFVWVRRAQFEIMVKDSRLAEEVNRRLSMRPPKPKFPKKFFK